MNLYLVVLIVYSLGMIAFGLVLGRRMKGASDFFVAGRQLGPGLLFSTLLASNIGASSTVGATSVGYDSGIAAWWWVGSAAIGSIALAFWIGPAMRRQAATHNLRTVGDYLECRYNAAVRGVVALLLWVGSIFLLAGQIYGIGSILDTVADVPSWVGCAIGGAVITAYFASGGLHATARVNVLQLAVKLGGFALALPLAMAAAGGWSAIREVRAADPVYWSFWRGGPPGLMYLALLTPSFIVSPGLLQKVFGARDDAAVRLGVGLNALGLFLYAGVPAILGIIARGQFPELENSTLALPTVLVRLLPPAVGAIGLAAVFSAEISAADALLFMLTTSLSQDLYKRFVNPAAGDSHLVLVARCTTVVAAVVSVLLAISLGSVVTAVTIFYTLLSVSLFVPMLTGLYVPRASSIEAMVSITFGIATVLAVQFGTERHVVAGLTPALAGLLAAAGSFVVVHLIRLTRHDSAFTL